MKKLLLLFLTIFGTYWTFGQVCETPHPANPAFIQAPLMHEVLVLHTASMYSFTS